MIKAILSSVFVIALLLSSVFAASSTTLVITNTANVVGFAPSSHKFDYVVVILLENIPLRAVVNGTSTPFMQAFAKNYSLAMQYTAIAHPSLPNYLAMFSGQQFNPWSAADCGPTGDTGSCTAKNATNLVDRLEAARLTWKAYVEDYPAKGTGKLYSSGGCYLGEEQPTNYLARHVPFLYFNDIIDNPSRCARIVEANSIVGTSQETDDVLLKDLGSVATASNFMWLTPNVLDDMHDSNMTFGDKYLSNIVPAILSSNVFNTQKAALFIVFDEGNVQYPSDWVYAVWAGPVAKRGYQSFTHYTHYSFLSTIEQNWGLHPFTSNDVNAPSMMEFFGS
ncbi:MAG: alkaline phosphatase family protein [Nitrososphaerales archaeon]|nr:alkaline phosphatase family protein [Nitrososphaerales archaeon]